MPSSTARAGGVQGVLDAGLLFLHLGLGGGADIDDGHAAHDLGQALGELLAVVVRGGLLDLGADLLHAALDLVGLAGAVHDGGVFLVDDHALGRAEIVDGHVLQLHARVLGHHLAAGEHGDVTQHLLAALAEARGLDGGTRAGCREVC